MGGDTIERITSTAASAAGVLSSVISALASTRLLSGEINSARPGPTSSGSSFPQASPYGVPTRVSDRIAPEWQISRACPWIVCRSSDVSPPSRT